MILDLKVLNLNNIHSSEFFSDMNMMYVNTYMFSELVIQLHIVST